MSVHGAPPVAALASRTWWIVAERLPNGSARPRGHPAADFFPDTAAFAVEAIRRWWQTMGAPLYPLATRLLVTADAGGSNGYRLRLWKLELQKLADETGLEIAVCHFPPGTSKWNKIEHRLFSAITMNWRGKPLTSHEVIVKLIAATTTRTGLRVRSALDENPYPAGVSVSDADMETLHLRPDAFHGEWNYSLLPRLMLPQE
jgi:Rhodopirellula transposase.